jgi:hypothetical protein
LAFLGEKIISRQQLRNRLGDELDRNNWTEVMSSETTEERITHYHPWISWIKIEQKLNLN